MAIYRVFNGVAPTATDLAAVTTGTAIKTMLQILGNALVVPKVKAWGVSMDGAAAAAGIQWELLTTGTIAATVTAHVAAGLAARNRAALLEASTVFFNVGTAATGYTASAEGTVTESRLFDSQIIQPTGQYAWEWSLDNEPEVEALDILRIRCLAVAAVNAICWVDLEV